MEELAAALAADPDNAELRDLLGTLEEVARLEALLTTTPAPQLEPPQEQRQRWTAGDVVWARDVEVGMLAQAAVVHADDGDDGEVGVLFLTPRSEAAARAADAASSTGVPAAALTRLRDEDHVAVPVGVRCLVRYDGDRVWYSGRLLRRHADGRADVVYAGYGPDAVTVNADAVVTLPPGEEDEDENDGSSDDDAEEVAREGGHATATAAAAEEDGDDPHLVTARFTAHDAMLEDGYVLGGWEQFTRGIGSKLLARMGYRHGAGLGRHAQGRVRPVEVEVLGRGRSLDFLDEDRAGRGGHGAAAATSGSAQRGRQRRRRAAAGKARALATAATAAASASGSTVFDFLNRRIADVAATGASPAGSPTPQPPLASAPAAVTATATAPAPPIAAGRFAPSPKATIHVQLVEVQQERDRVRAKFARLKGAHGRLSGDAVSQRVVRDQLASLHAEHKRLSDLEKQLQAKRDGDKLRRSLTTF